MYTFPPALILLLLGANLVALVFGLKYNKDLYRRRMIQVAIGTSVFIILWAGVSTVFTLIGVL